MQNVKVGQQVITPDGKVGIVTVIREINNQGTGVKKVDKAKVKYSQSKNSTNESWFGLSQLKPYVIQVLNISDEEAFEDSTGLDTEKVNPEVKPFKATIVKAEPQDEASF